MITPMQKVADEAKNNKRAQSDDVMNLASWKMQYFCKHSVSYFPPPCKYTISATSVVHSVSTYTDGSRGRQNNKNTVFNITALIKKSEQQKLNIDSFT